jgi:hypothetical protein
MSANYTADQAIAAGMFVNPKQYSAAIATGVNEPFMGIKAEVETVITYTPIGASTETAALTTTLEKGYNPLTGNYLTKAGTETITLSLLK